MRTRLVVLAVFVSTMSYALPYPANSGAQNSSNHTTNNRPQRYTGQVQTHDRNARLTRYSYSDDDLPNYYDVVGEWEPYELFDDAATHSVGAHQQGAHPHAIPQETNAMAQSSRGQPIGNHHSRVHSPTGGSRTPLDIARQAISNVEQEVSNAGQELIDVEEEISNAEWEIREAAHGQQDHSSMGEARQELDRALARLGRVQEFLQEARNQLERVQEHVPGANVRTVEALAAEARSDVKVAREHIDEARAQMQEAQADMNGQHEAQYIPEPSSSTGTTISSRFHIGRINVGPGSWELDTRNGLTIRPSANSRAGPSSAASAYYRQRPDTPSSSDSGSSDRSFPYGSYTNRGFRRN